MDAGDDVSEAVASIADAIGEPARARMLFSLLDGHARTSTELAILGGVSPSTASVHLGRLVGEGLVRVAVQGKHRYFTLASKQVARSLESLAVVAGTSKTPFTPRTPSGLRAARTCYDHLAGTAAVALRDRFVERGWLTVLEREDREVYETTAAGVRALKSLGVDLDAARASRRRFAVGCLDWSERRPHIGGALGAALLATALQRGWIEQDLDSRAVSITSKGKRELFAGVQRLETTSTWPMP